MYLHRWCNRGPNAGQTAVRPWPAQRSYKRGTTYRWRCHIRSSESPQATGIGASTHIYHRAEKTVSHPWQLHEDKDNTQTTYTLVPFTLYSPTPSIPHLSLSLCLPASSMYLNLVGEMAVSPARIAQINDLTIKPPAELLNDRFVILHRWRCGSGVSGGIGNGVCCNSGMLRRGSLPHIHP